MSDFLPGTPTESSSSGRPVMALLNLLGRRTALRVLWELRNTRMTFRALQNAAYTNPSVLNARLKELREGMIIDHNKEGYGLTATGQSLLETLLPLNNWAENWARKLQG